MSEVNGDDERIDSARKTAADLSPVLRRQARRPFVLEITGTPKAGKTTLISMLDSFLRACGWRVHVLKERAGECPLPMKGHFFFNTWTTGTMLAGLLDAVDREHDIVILDRGIFDALIWLEIQEKQGQVSQAERTAFDEFVTLERWRRLVDLVCAIEVDPTIAMERENNGRLVPRKGSVMNEPSLRHFNECLRNLEAMRADQFDFVVLNNARDAKQGALDVIEQVLPAVRDWCDPEIAVIPRAVAPALVPEEVIAWSPDIEQRLLGAIQYRLRSEVEDSNDWVQILACGCQTNAGEVFLVVRRPGRDEVPRARDNSALIWRGCHIAKPESSGLRIEHLRAQLKDRLCSDLHLGDLATLPEPKGLVWTPGGKESRHLGIVFEVPVRDNVAEWLDEKQFKTNGRGYMLESSFVRAEELAAADTIAGKGYKLEQWSRLILDQRWLP